MDKRKLYESIMQNVSKEVKKTLNESYKDEPNNTIDIDLTKKPIYYSDDEILDMVNPALIDIDDIPEINLSDLTKLPTPLLKQLIFELYDLDVECIDWDDKNDHAYIVSIIDKPTTILLRSAEDYGIGLTYDTYVNVNVEYTPGYSSNDRDVPDDPPEYNNTLDMDVELSLNDGDPLYIIKLDEKSMKKVKYDLESSNIFDDVIEQAYERYDPNDAWYYED